MKKKNKKYRKQKLTALVDEVRKNEFWLLTYTKSAVFLNCWPEVSAFKIKGTKNEQKTN